MNLVPIVSDLEFYSEKEKQKYRYDSVKERFIEIFKTLPLFYARAPGRVNLIGEHIDYCHFSVLPMAIEADVIAAVAPTSKNTIIIANTDANFESVEIELPHSLNAEIPIDKENPSWADYFKCGLLVARKYMVESGNGDLVKIGKLKGFSALFDGRVPTGGGLSSSAAFCITATLAVLWVNGVTKITKSDLTKITVVCEHYVGLSNGGMDQSASINGEAQKVLLVSFKPNLDAVPFAFPKTSPKTVFLISNSLVTANKTETAPSNYNLRVVEVAIAADIIAHKFGLDVVPDSNIHTATLRGVFDAYFTQKLDQDPWDGKNIDVGIVRLTQMLQLVESLYSESEKENGISVDEAMMKTGHSSRTVFENKYFSHFPVKFDTLQIYRRTKHVYSDSLRVLKTLKAAKDFETGVSDTTSAIQFLTEFGELMNESQESTKTYNQASTIECDELCALGRKHGSFGSRVTGAGFGGCVVHLTTDDKVEQLTKALVERYYKRRFPDISEKDLSQAIVVSKPAMGACIVKI